MRKIQIVLFFIMLNFISAGQNRKQSIQWLKAEDITNTRYFIWRGDTIDFTLLKDSLYVFLSDSLNVYVTPKQLMDSLATLEGGHDPVSLNSTATSGGLSLSGQELSFTRANNSQNGYLDFNDFMTFQNKLSSVSHDALFTGLGTTFSPLKLDTGFVATRYWVDYTFLKPGGNLTGTFNGQNSAYYLNYNNLINAPVVSSTAFGPSWESSTSVATMGTLYDAFSSISGLTTNLTYNYYSDKGIMASSTGTGDTIPAGSTTYASLMLPGDKTKLNGIAEGAEVNINADWNATTGDGQILNKPDLSIYQQKGDTINFITPEILSDSLDNYWSKTEITSTDTSHWFSAYNNQIVSLGVTGTTTKTITATQQDGGTVTTTFTDLVNDADSDPTNELITSVVYNNDSLKITEAGITHKVKIEAGGATNVVDAYSNKVAVSNSTVSVNWPTAFSNTNYFLLINAYYEEIINGKNIRVENAVYDFSKTVNGFSLKVDTVMGYIEYFAADTTNLYPLAFDNYLAESDSLVKYVTPNQLSDSLSNVVISEIDPIFTSDSMNIVYWSDTTSIIETKANAAATYQPKGSYLTSEVDGSVENEGKLSIVAGGTNAAIIKSNTANSDSIVVVGGSGVTIAVSNDTINVSSTGGSGGASLLDLVGYQQGGWSASVNSSTGVSVWGMLTGFSSVDASSSFVGGTYGSYLRQNTSNTSGNDATTGTSSSAFIFASSYPLLSVKFALISYASSDFYAGFKNTLEDGYVATSMMIGLYFNSGDSEFKFVTGNGTSTTVTGTGVSLSTDVYILVIDVSPALVTFYLYDYNYSLLSSATHTTNIPTNELGVVSSIETQTSSARSIAQYSGNIKLRK